MRVAIASVWSKELGGLGSDGGAEVPTIFVGVLGRLSACGGNTLYIELKIRTKPATNLFGMRCPTLCVNPSQRAKGRSLIG